MAVPRAILTVSLVLALSAVSMISPIPSAATPPAHTHGTEARPGSCQADGPGLTGGNTSVVEAVGAGVASQAELTASCMPGECNGDAVLTTADVTCTILCLFGLCPVTSTSTSITTTTSTSSTTSTTFGTPCGDTAPACLGDCPAGLTCRLTGGTCSLGGTPCVLGEPCGSGGLGTCVPTECSCQCYRDLGSTVLDGCTGLEWEKKTGADNATPGFGTPDPDNLHDVDNRYTWAGCCDGDCSDVANLCQPNPAAAATCFSQAELDTTGCSQCAFGSCDVDPLASGAITTVWDWINRVNAVGFTGHQDWRLPSQAGADGACPGCARELESIVDLTQGVCGGGSGACIDPIFGPTAPLDHWSGSASTLDPVNAWLVYFGNGNAISDLKVLDSHVRAVRPGS
jgi:hypothetical protein